MTDEDYFSERYKSGKASWEIGKPDFNLIEVVSQKPIPNCKALDIGCGTGDDAIWLAQRNFNVVGIDTSNIAVEKAREKADQSKVSCTFMVADFLNDKIDGLPFLFVFDRGCFHSFDSEDDRNRFAENIAVHLKDGGLWLSIVGNADEKRDDPGPPQRTATDIVLAVEPYFEILRLQSGLFGSKSQNPPRAWRCLMRKRCDQKIA